MLWGKENLCLIRPLGDSLALETLYFAEDVREREARSTRRSPTTKVEKAELAMAVQLVGSLKGEFDPDGLPNEYRDQLRAMLEAKLAGKEIAVPEAAETAPVIDLMDALKQSVAARRRRRRLPRSPAKPQQGAAAPSSAASGALSGLLERARRLELRLEEGLVDLPVVDRHRLLMQTRMTSSRSIPSSLDSSSGVR